ncbi:glycosyltransferase [Cetobacterium somerae]|uniref:glycosyltransferase n=1 Tax=Cetobacterium somerae TaxID=188913 RepID=UPI00211E0A20|nr:glycosyltransferase [Cetobacterium somerae]MCQ9628111.1 glycosyltransferase [Cetobacterium somerae]
MVTKSLNKEKNFVSIVAYLKNNENDIQNFSIELDRLLKEKFEAYEFVFVNDNSEDKTKQKLKEISDSLTGNVVVIDLAYNHGLEVAMLAGVDFAIGDFIFEFDTVKINYNLDDILKIYYKSLEGFDIVSATPRGVQNKSSQIFYQFLNSVSYRKMELTTEIFRIVSRRALNRVLKNKEKLRYRKALYHYSGFNTFIYEYEPINQNKIVSNLSIKEKINLGLDVLVNFSDIGIKIAINISILFLLITLFTLSYTIYSYLTLDKIQSGWTTMMLFMSVSFSGIFFVLAILAKYMTVTMIEIKDRPSYVFKGVDRLSKK